MKMKLIISLRIIILWFATLFYSQTIMSQKPGNEIGIQSVQHVIVNKGEKFNFNYINTHAYCACAGYDKQVNNSKKHQAFKISFENMQYKRLAFMLRHPVQIVASTGYVLRYRTFIKEMPDHLPTIEFAVYDQTRETKVESHNFPIEKREGWHQGEIRFKTRNLAHYARLLIYANPSEKPGEVYFDNIELEQYSTPHFFKPEEIPVCTIENFDMGSSNPIIAEMNPLSDRNYYKIDINFTWDEPSDSCKIIFEWYDSQRTVIGKEICILSSMKGVLPIWNGVEVSWKKLDDKKLHWISRGKRRFFNEDGKDGIIEYTTKKPVNAVFVRAIREGLFLGRIQNMAIVADY